MKYERVIGLAIVMAMLGYAPAWASTDRSIVPLEEEISAVEKVDISSMAQIKVSDWATFKAAVENPANAGKAIVLTKDIIADANDPITTIGGQNIVVDGGNFTISGHADGGSFLVNNYWEDKNFVIQNITLSGFKGTSDENPYIRPSAIYNPYSIQNIHADFIGNSVVGISNTPSTNGISTFSIAGGGGGSDFADIVMGYTKGIPAAAGSAIYNKGFIGNVTGVFRDNFAQFTSNPSGISSFSQEPRTLINAAQGGAIYNYGNLFLVNSSFYDNYVATDASKDSLDGQFTQGGAIYNEGNLLIAADGAVSEFSGNKVKWGDGEDSSALFLNSLNSKTYLGAVNGGLLKFDDKISSIAQIDDILLRLKNENYKVSDDGEGGYFAEDPYGEIYHIQKVEKGYLIPMYSTPALSEQEILEVLGEFPPEFVTIENGNYIIRGEVDGYSIYMDAIKQADGSYTVTEYQIASNYGANLNIIGDESGRVEFNNALENIGTIDISGTNVDMNNGVGTIYRTITHDGGVTNINANVTAEDNIINKGGTMNVADTAKVYRTEINDGGLLHVATGGFAQDTTVNSGGQLSAEAQATLNNMLANDGAKLDIDMDAFLTGNIIIHSGALMGGTYDYNKIFKDEITDAGSLTLVGGLNDILTENSLVNSTDEKKLNLTDGNYVIGDGAQAVSGWDLLTFKDKAYVKLEGDIYLKGPNRKLIIENGSTLDLAGNSPTNYTINGSVSNDAMMTFTHPDDEADDITTIYGNYKAYNNAQMEIDVSPSTNTADLLRIDGDVEGTTNVTLNVLEYDVRPTQLIQFVEAANDDLSTGAYFNIYRVNNSAFNWNSLHLDDGWYTATDDIILDDTNEGYGTSNTGTMEDDVDLEADAVLPPNFPPAPTTPDFGFVSKGNPSVVGEAIAYMGLPSAGIEQTRDLTRNVASKVAASKVYNPKACSFYDTYYDGKVRRNAWASPVYSYSDVKAPFAYEAKISGLDAGFDIQSDFYNRLGVFASYRQGNYDFDGKGDDYYSKKGAEIDIDSYILGLYHRYDKGQMWAISQLFAGYQDVDLASDDGVSSSTDGFEFGASVEAGVAFVPTKDVTIEPTARVTYTQINYDDASDAYGKTAAYGDVRQLEFEAGVKFEKTYLSKYDYAKLYIKPSIIQTIGSGDVQVTSLRQVDGLKNATLGRIEVGGSMNFDSNWSGYANAFYTFGNDYTNIGANAGVNYAF